MLLEKLPKKARCMFRVPEIEHNLIAAAELIDAGRAVYFHKHGCKIECEEELLYKGLQDTTNRLW